MANKHRMERQRAVGFGHNGSSSRNPMPDQGLTDKAERAEKRARNWDYKPRNRITVWRAGEGTVKD